MEAYVQLLSGDKHFHQRELQGQTSLFIAGNLNFAVSDKVRAAYHPLRKWIRHKEPDSSRIQSTPEGCRNSFRILGNNNKRKAPKNTFNAATHVRTRESIPSFQP